MELPFGLSPLSLHPTVFHFHQRQPSRSPSPSTSSIRSIQSIHSILLQRRHRRRTSISSIIPSARSSMFGEETEDEGMAVMAIMEPRPLGGSGGIWVGIGEVLDG
ncbi:hypothetical protein N7G274_003717 [Stereocaulon virgatum]|uniref:Uncharacterized protein n=1 Tax=Stereocaulon virgatum TaxID=373712 RepID=A0ABR4AEX9_9LECA